MKNILLILVILAIVLLAALYIYRAKKRGQKCIGCPNGCTCSKSCSACNGCAVCSPEEQEKPEHLHIPPK